MLSGHNAWAGFILHYQFWKKFFKTIAMCWQNINCKTKQNNNINKKPQSIIFILELSKLLLSI